MQVQRRQVMAEPVVHVAGDAQALAGEAGRVRLEHVDRCRLYLLTQANVAADISWQE
nr:MULTISPECIES: hypothetical protein [unclassified Halomonas]